MNPVKLVDRNGTELPVSNPIPVKGYVIFGGLNPDDYLLLLRYPFVGRFPEGGHPIFVYANLNTRWTHLDFTPGETLEVTKLMVTRTALYALETEPTVPDENSILPLPVSKEAKKELVAQ